MSKSALHRRILWGLFGIVAVGVAAYIAAVFLTRGSLEDVGRTLARGVSASSVTSAALPAGSVLLLDGDTVAAIVSVAQASGSTQRDSIRLYAGHAREAAEHRLLELRDYVAIRQAAAADSGAERMQLVPISRIGSRTQLGVLVLRAAQDSGALQTFPVF